MLDFRSGGPALCSPHQVAPSFKASRLKVADGLDLDEVFNIGVDPLVKHDLAGFGGVAQARAPWRPPGLPLRRSL